MKKRITASALTLSLFLGSVLGGTAFADGGKNRYGHSITYTPVTQLYAGNEPIRFFDAAITEWGGLSDKITQNEAESVKWLTNNKYLLNHFGRKLSGDLSGCINHKGEWQTQITGPRNVRSWAATVRFDPLIYKEGRENGNINNMYEKGDLQYFLSWKVKTVQTKWGISGKSNDTGMTYVFDELINSSGGGWKSYNTIKGGPNLYDNSAWKNGDKLWDISFWARSDRDARVDSYLSGAMLVGRDIKGPQISTVRVTADEKGEKEFDSGAVTLDDLKNLKDNTIYFQVEWDEPVMFKNLSRSALENLTLKIDTIGIDGTSGMLAEAPFLKFAPKKTDGKPVMVFEYKIPDPYTDFSSVTQERGYFYKFSKVTVSENENKELWNNIYDISGNKFAADENGQQPANKVAAPVSGSTAVDLTPFGIKKISLSKDIDENSTYITPGELLEITLELNKTPGNTANVMNMPEVELNIKDENGKNIVIKPSKEDMKKYIPFYDRWVHMSWYRNSSGYMQPVMYDFGTDRVTYYVQLYGNCTAEGDSVKVKSVTSAGERIKDNSGYQLMDYALNSDGMLAPVNLPEYAQSKTSKYTVSPDRQYKLDFTAPAAEISVEDLDDGVVMLTADIDDPSLEGCTVSFTAKANGRTYEDGSMLYQAASGEKYTDTGWQTGTPGTPSVSFNAPVIANNGKGKAYGFIKLPEKSEFDKLDVTLSVADAAGNAANAEKTFVSDYDTAAPIVNAVVNNETVNVEISDLDADVTYMYGYSDNDADEPSYTTESGKSGTIQAPDIPLDGAIHEKTVCIKASDSKGNTSEALKLPIKFDRTYTEITFGGCEDKTFSNGEYPQADITVENAKSYWYAWIEKPANTADIAASLTENMPDAITENAVTSGELADDDPSTPQYNNTTADKATLTAATQVLSINPVDESYGGYVSAENTTRPVVLVVCADKGDGTVLVKTHEFDTFYSAPYTRMRPVRFSTNNSVGKRTDYVRNSENTGLLWPDDEVEIPLNTPCLYGFMQAELYLAADPVTDLNRIDLENSTVTFERVVYNDFSISTNEIERKAVTEWKLSDLGLQKLSGVTQSKLMGTAYSPVYSAIIDIDPKTFDLRHYDFDENGTRNNLRYEFVCNLKYTADNVAEDKKTAAYFAFNNTPEAFLSSSDTGSWGGVRISELYDCKNVPAMFDKNGKDVTTNVPVYTLSTIDYYGDPTQCYIKFSATGGDADTGSDIVYYGAPPLNIADKSNTSRLTMAIGTSPDKLTEILPFEYDYGEFNSNRYCVSDYFTGDDSKPDEVTLYYKFMHPDRGESSPVYVLKIRRDNVPPVLDVTISETEKMTKEVRVKVNSVYDIQSFPDGTVTIDTPDANLEQHKILDAYRYAGPDDIVMHQLPDEQESPDEYYYGTMIPVFPDKDGIYHFKTNGFFRSEIRDNAGNKNSFIIVNGKVTEVKRQEGDDFAMYRITNVSGEPPEFSEEPQFTANTENGSFKINAKADDSVKRVYLKFDNAYSGEFADGEGMYDIEAVPGLLSGKFDTESGTIDAEIFVKPSDTPLSKATLVIEDAAGCTSEYEYTFTEALYGKKAEITNTKNENGYPEYTYGGKLRFNVPVKIDNTFDFEHQNLPIYSDGITEIEFTDLFGTAYSQKIYADIFGVAFAHSLIFTADGREISPQTAVSSDVTVKIDTTKTKDLVVVGDNEMTFSENGVFTYSLKNNDITKTFTASVTNIDKTAPEAIVSVDIDSETGVLTDEVYTYSVTYSVEGFSEDGVTLISDSNGAAPYSVTFDGNSENKTYTFRFRDKAGNEGAYTADVSDTVFSQRADSKITGYRLTYKIADENGYTTLGRFEDGENADIGLVNRAVFVKAEAVNKDGAVVSSAVEVQGAIPENTSVLAKENLVAFTGESAEDRTVTLTLKGTGNGNLIPVSVTLPKNTIDLTAPTGTVYYKADGNSVRAYLVVNDTDLTENGVYVTGTKNDGTEFVLESDENGYYTEFDANGTGKFVLTDKAGNVGTVLIAVLSIDNEPPRIIAEGWQNQAEASADDKAALAELLATPTNNSIKLFLTFNEQLKGAEVKAYDNKNDLNPLTPADDYVTAIASGATLTVEFKQNCQAMLTVYDLRDNAYTVWRPEDGPITAIDRDIPKLLPNYPLKTLIDNAVVFEYIFADNENVRLLREDKTLKDGDDGFKNRHVITVNKNGQQIFSFADRAGNVFSDYPVVSEIDESAPKITIFTDYIGEGRELSGNDSYTAGNFYTNKNVRILFNAEDENSPDGIKISAETKSGGKVQVIPKPVTAGNGKTYSHHVIVSENGAYRITAEDKWGHKNTVETNVSVIDKTPPKITLKGGNNVVVKTKTSEDSARSAIKEGITAIDSQSGANAPLGDRELKNVTPGVTTDVNLSGVNLNKQGTYTAKVTASDRLGNKSEKQLTVTVADDIYTFCINGTVLYANDIFTTAKGKITLQNASSTAKYYYRQGYKTAAQMKYADTFEADTGFNAVQDGYYTILARENNKKAYLLYVYVN